MRSPRASARSTHRLEPFGPAAPECLGIGIERPELGEAAMGLFEVVAENLLELGHAGAADSSSQPAKRSCNSARVSFGSER